jgi:hypothetical protein
MNAQKDDEQTIIRSEQEKKQQRSTRPRKRKNRIHDIDLDNLKKSYEQKLINIKQYQKQIRAISYAYINVLDKESYNSDSE